MYNIYKYMMGLCGCISTGIYFVVWKEDENEKTIRIIYKYR